MKLTKILILFLFLSLKGFSQQAQCVSVKKVNGNEVRTNIPCDFPISTSEIVSFSEALNTWYTNNPTLKAVVLTPNSYPSNNSIEIPFLIYDQFSDAKKKTVNGIPYFYKIINN
jgi:hypothetical protein